MSKSILFDTVFYMCEAVCNYDCLFCRNHIRSLPEGAKGFNPVLFEHVISRGQTICVTANTGEMLLMPWFPRMVAILAQHGKAFSLTTNGSPLREKNIELLRTSTLNMLSISINSLDSDTYKTLTGGAKLSLVLDNVEQVFASGQQYRVQFTFVISALNIKELKSFVDIGSKYKSNVVFYPLTPTIADYDLRLKLPATQGNIDLLNEARRYASERGVALTTFNLSHEKSIDSNTLSEEYLSRKIKECFVPFKQIYIFSNGLVAQCCWGGDGRYLGDLETESVDALWNNARFTELRQCLKNGDTRYCKLCRLWG